MRLILKTPVQGHYIDVMSGFDLDLFNSLKPIGAKMEVTKFTGSKTGDTLALRFTSPIKAEWVSDIVDHGQDDKQAFFIDQGIHLPWPLKSWKHKHIVEYSDNKSSVIIDDIDFSAGYGFFDVLIYPFMYLGFYPRKAGYKKYFNKPS